MSIRLIKISKDLNVGISCLVEFLHKKGFEVEANPNIKIDSEKHELLVKEFGKDLDIQALLNKREEKKEVEKAAAKLEEEKKLVIPEEIKPQIQVVKKNDLDALKPSIKKAESHPKIFVSYSHQNRDWVDKDGKYSLIPWLETQLKRQKVIFWTDHILSNHIGEDYKINIKKNIDDSDIALLLISQEFSSSDFILDYELPWIKEAFESGTLIIIPLLIGSVSKSSKKNLGWVFDLQLIPNETTPILRFANDDVKWDEIRISIIDAIDSKIDIIKQKNKEYRK